MAKTVFDEPGSKVRLEDIPPDPPKGMTKDKAAERFASFSQELFDLQEEMYGARVHSVLVVLQGRDTAGKDGTIKHVVGALNPRGVSVTSFGVPTEVELRHDFLWRVHQRTPELGEFGIFNRSHYEDVLVTRVHQLVPKKTWKARYRHIADFEQMLAEHGMLVLKFFLHISKDEQEDRLLERDEDAKKAWKLDANDWTEREYWDDYTEAYEDAISHTAAEHAPWTVVPANAKWYRNLVVAESIVDALRRHRDDWRQTLERMAVEARARIAESRKAAARKAGAK
jgi:PPK2 family polyphosphate:nucleotide phosphotransferase